MTWRTTGKLWLERIGVGIVTVIALAAPFVFGLAYYLAVVEEGLAINDGDPLREARIWLVRERRGASGLAVQTTASAAGADPAQAAQCARTNVIFLSWTSGLRVDEQVSYCKCYRRAGNQWNETALACAP